MEPVSEIIESTINKAISPLWMFPRTLVRAFVRFGGLDATSCSPQ